MQSIEISPKKNEPSAPSSKKKLNQKPSPRISKHTKAKEKKIDSCSTTTKMGAIDKTIEHEVTKRDLIKVIYVLIHTKF